MKNKIIKLLLLNFFIFFAIGASSVHAEPASDDVFIIPKSTSTEKQQSDTATKKAPATTASEVKTIKETPNSEKVAKPALQTKSPQSFKNILLKFVFAIIWVVFSSFAIFIILISYKKLILKEKKGLPKYKNTEHSLQTPKNFKEAFKLFLDKTKWN